MGEWLIVLAIVAVGAQLAVQAPVNSRLGDRVGRLGAALVSNLVGTAIIAAAFLAVLVTGNVGGSEGPSGLAGTPAWEMVGGLIGAAWVAVSAITVGRIGAGVVASAAITGQLICSLVIDQLGLAGVERQAVTAPRLAGALLLIAGTAMVARRAAGSPAGEARRHLLALAAVFVTGLLMGFQHPLNGLLSETVGDLTSGLLNFLVGTALLIVVVALSGRGRELARVRGVEPIYLIGGLLGVITVIASLVAVKAVGATALAAGLITGQLGGSVALDRLGAFGLERRPLTRRRSAGVLLLLVGTVLAIS